MVTPKIENWGVGVVRNLFINIFVFESNQIYIKSAFKWMSVSDALESSHDLQY